MINHMVKNTLEVFLILCRICAVFFSFEYFLFANAFWGTLDGTQTLAGFMGIAVGILGRPITAGKKLRPMVIISLSYATLMIIGFDLYRYYSENAFPGNYDWYLVGPLCISLPVIMLQYTINSPSNQQPKPTP